MPPSAINSGATVTVTTYAKRYGVDRFTAYGDLAALGFALPTAAQRWAQGPAAIPCIPCRAADRRADRVTDEWWIMLDGRMFFVVGYTSGGAPYGMFADEMQSSADPDVKTSGT
jgi:hypothetical protein